MNEQLRHSANEQAQAMLSDLSGVSAVLIATIDGFDAGSASRGGHDPRRLAALASSIAAVGDVATVEAQLGRSRCITVETGAGFVLVHSVPRPELPLVIAVLAGEDAVLGLVKYRVAAAATALAG